MAVAFSVENLSYKYPSSEENVIKGISFDVLEGEILDCWVPREQGNPPPKILIRLLEGYRGTIKYFGKNLNSMDNSFMRR